MEGLLLVDKPKGITSQTVCNVIKRKLNISKVGHNGTLDPNTTGLMVVAAGSATKLLKLINEHDKEYIATVIFGYDTPSLDLDCDKESIQENEMSVTLEDIRKGMEKLKLQKEQYPPMTSAIKIDGKKLYEYQRQNIEVEVKPRPVTLYDYEILSDLKNYQGHQEIDIRVSVSKGYYVRALARDLGKLLGGTAVLHELRRTKAGTYDVIKAKTLDDITVTDLIPVTEFFDFPKVEVKDYMRKLVLNGVELDERQTTQKGVFYVTNKCDIIAIYEEVGNSKYKPVLIFK